MILSMGTISSTCIPRSRHFVCSRPFRDERGGSPWCSAPQDSRLYEYDWDCGACGERFLATLGMTCHGEMTLGCAWNDGAVVLRVTAALECHEDDERLLYVGFGVVALNLCQQIRYGVNICAWQSERFLNRCVLSGRAMLA